MQITNLVLQTDKMTNKKR